MGPSQPLIDQVDSEQLISNCPDLSNDNLNISWPRRHNSVLTFLTACIAPLSYLWYIDYFAVNSFLFDDWSTFDAMVSGLHGHIDIGQLWLQYTEGRQLISNIFFVLFAVLNHADIRTILFFNATVYIATYIIILAAFRRYLSRSLTPIPIFTIGLTWFSFGDVGNSLFAYQLSVYLTVFCIVGLYYALLIPETHLQLWFAVAVMAAVAASFSFIDGFLAWPLGVCCIFWRQSSKLRIRQELIAWLTAMLATCLVYFSGYRASGCAPIANCSVTGSLHQPLAMIRVFLALLGMIIPNGWFSPNGAFSASWSPFSPPHHSIFRFELLGAFVLVLCLHVLIRSWRDRASTEHFPLPMLLILFGLFWDAMTTVGRTGLGVDKLVAVNRYIMPNVIVLTALVMYAWAHWPPSKLTPTSGARSLVSHWLLYVAVACLVIAQSVVSIPYGISNGRVVKKMFTTEAQLWVNLDRIPIKLRSCEVNVVIDNGLFKGGPPNQPAQFGLGEFMPNSFRYFRHLGPPPISPLCSRASSAHELDSS